MPPKIDQYLTDLKSGIDWIPYLCNHSGLPGPRGNLELAQAVAICATRDQVNRLLTLDENHPAENTPENFVVFCGVKALGKFASTDAVARQLIRSYASDSRWRIREAVAMALQIWGKENMDGLLSELQSWPDTDPLELRAIAAGICEPALLTKPDHAIEVINLMDKITRAFLSFSDRKADNVLTLRQGLAYCWSVAVAAYPDPGKASMERWLQHPDPDIQWIMRENLKKNRLVKMDPAWVSKFI